MNGWLIYDERAAIENYSYITWFIDEAKRQHVNIRLVLREQLQIGIYHDRYDVTIDGKEVPLPHFVVIRTIEPTLQTYFHALNVITFNSSAVAAICNDKSLTHLHVHKLNVPMVDTYFIKRSSFPRKPPLPYPFVVKDAYGRSGTDVYYVREHSMWRQIPHQLTSENIIVQGANVQLGKDVRVFVIGKKIVAAVLRHNERDFRANYSLGGDAHIYHLSTKERQMIQKIVDYFQFDLVGIDFLLSEKGELLFNEIEDVVGSRILSKVTNINLLEMYVTHIKKTVVQCQAHSTETEKGVRP
ncbi:MAG TPA: hypothetical protein VK029_02020 [Pseudogracilibacillus sp.]|nr:hypothetical protein [Pseudogracilibacillus sp.]